MTVMTKEIRENLDTNFELRKKAILERADNIKISGKAYFVAADGNDDNDGCSPETPWCTLTRVSSANLCVGDGVFFKRGDIFRGKVHAKQGVTYAAYGNGEKPRLYGSEYSLADSALWELYDSEHHIWKCTKKQLDSGTLVFNDGKEHACKLIPSYINGRFVCREDESKIFDIRSEMKNDLDLYWHFQGKFSTAPTKGKNFPIPEINNAYGELYLRCDRGNPGEVFDSVESLARSHMFTVGDAANVTLDNLCIKYVGMHGVSAGGYVVGLHVIGCEFGWIGGTIQGYQGMDPNYPEGDRGSVTRFGNAIEIYGGCDDYIASDNYIYEVYDAGITHQYTTRRKITMTNIRYERNVIDRCVYGIEYFLNQYDGERESYMDGILMADNYIRLSGYGWGQQRHNKHTPALIKGWSYVNTARNYMINNNIFDRCAFRMLHLVSEKDSSKPLLSGNTFIQHENGMLGQIGANEIDEPPVHVYDANIEHTIYEIFGDRTATVYIIK